MDTEKKPPFQELAADNVEEDGPLEIESLCVDCERNGTTKLLLTKIPMFKEVVVSSFSCPHCGASNSSIQSGAPIEPKGVKYCLRVKTPEHLNRMIVKGETATVSIPELEFEIPPSSDKGSITTVENILMQAVEGLEKQQPIRRALHPDLAAKLDAFIVQLRDCMELKQTFSLIIDDPTGNSYVENTLAPQLDPCLNVEHYVRSEQQDKQLGATTATPVEVTSDTEQDAGAGPVEKDEVVEFPTNCYHCSSPAKTRMKQVDIPHFKQVIIMATICNYCGYRSNEVKSGTGVSPTGSRMSLRITSIADLNRDMVASETCVLRIPSLDFECSHASFGGRFTTVEGLLTEVKTDLQRANPFLGDSVPQSRLAEFLERLSEIINGSKLGVDIILDDPAGNSFIQNICAPEPDHNLTIIQYQRTFEQNDELGLNDMNTEHYMQT